MNLNQFFAERILKDQYTEERGQFLKALMQSAREGNLCLYAPEAPLLPDAVLSDGSQKTPIVRQGHRYYLHRNWELESKIVQEIERLLNGKVEALIAEIDGSLLPMQAQAVQRALRQSFSIICGGPGTGKTYTAAALVRAFLTAKPQAKVVIAAPTGKAASHLSTLLGSSVQSATLHRLLRILPGEYKNSTALHADLVLVDEASMIDVPLLAQLLGAIENGARLVLMGDPDQLPPVEAGTLFRELAESFGTKLEKSMRRENEELGLLADQMNQGAWTNLPLLSWGFDEKLVDRLIEKMGPVVFSEAPDPEKCFAQMNRFRVLGALRQGPFGTDALNEQIRHKMESKIKPGQWWVFPILVTRNQPDQELYNGSCGVLIGKSRGRISLTDATAYFPHKVPYKMLPPHEIAFCLSIHKSQGSEFERVLALFPEGSENFGKEAAYTAVTRAKKQVEIVAADGVLKAMLMKHASNTSGFKERYLAQRAASLDLVRAAF